MATIRRRFTAQFKAKVAMEALRGDRTIQAIAAKHEVTATIRLCRFARRPATGRGDRNDRRLRPHLPCPGRVQPEAATWSSEELDSSNDHSGNANASAYGPAQRCHLLFRNKCLHLFDLLLDRGDIGVCCHSVHPLFQERDARIGVTSHY